LSTSLPNPYHLLVSCKPPFIFTILAINPFRKLGRVILKVKEFWEAEEMGLIVRSELVEEKYMEGYPQLKEML